MADFSDFRVDGTLFSLLSRHKRGKLPRRNRCDGYCLLALQLLKKEFRKQKTDNPSYGFPKELLEFFRTLILGDIKGEIRDDTYNVLMKEFCDALGLDKISYILLDFRLIMHIISDLWSSDIYFYYFLSPS